VSPRERRESTGEREKKMDGSRRRKEDRKVSQEIN
jgi:hypothetical protein